MSCFFSSSAGGINGTITIQGLGSSDEQDVKYEGTGWEVEQDSQGTPFQVSRTTGDKATVLFTGTYACQDFN